jgi:hypothetical protein
LSKLHTVLALVVAAAVFIIIFTSCWDIAKSRVIEVCRVTGYGWNFQVCGGFSSHECATKWLSFMFSHVLTLSMVDTSPFTIKEHLIVNMWVQKKGQSGQRYDKIRASFLPCILIQQLWLRLIYVNWRKKFLTSSVLHAK